MSIRSVQVRSVTGYPVTVDVTEALGQPYVRISIAQPSGTVLYTSVEPADWEKLRDVGQPWPPGRAQQIIAAATEIAKHWHEQEGVNAALIDKLADLVLG